MEKEYTIGLDIGTNSVGWAVLTEDYQLIKRKMKVQGNGKKTHVKKNFWGVRLFDEGTTAAERRISRTTRRRYERRRNRLGYLQEIFNDEMQKVDNSFFHRLEDSFLTADEKRNDRHPVFATLEEERAYHRDFPTIYHLRRDLADKDEQADLRLVYLALAHIVKYRGHFLIEGKLDAKNSSVAGTFKEFLEKYKEAFGDLAVSSSLQIETDIEKIFTEKVSRTKKAENALKLFPEEKSTGTLMQFFKVIVGNQGEFKKMLVSDESMKIQFSKDTYEDDLEAILATPEGNNYEDVFTAAKNTYDAVVLSNILTVKDEQTNAKISASMVQRFSEHKDELKKFKQFVIENLPDKFHEIFRDKEKEGYAGYIENGVTQENFYKYLKKTLDKVENAQEFLNKIEQEDFLRKQRTFDNGVIPHQLHLQEMRAIIDRQARFYPFLRENQARLETLVTFRIPYYIGPLAQGKQSEFAWLERKEAGPLRPWNLEEKVDYGKSATEFIQRMTNFDSYLPEERVLPKHSLLYQKYAVFNELTKIRYVDERGDECNFDSVEKKKIFESLFKKQRTVKRKMLQDFLKNEYNIAHAEIKGLDKAGKESQNFNANYGTYHDFLKWGVSEEFLDAPENEDTLEEIVKLMTLFQDRKMLYQQLSKFSDKLAENLLKKLARHHYNGWGRLSKELIHGIRDKQSGKTILDYLMRDDGPRKNINRNFQQLINDEQLSFKGMIEKAQIIDEKKDIKTIVGDLAGSPAIKKGILQSLKIVEELVAIMGYPPTNIVIEMARENQRTRRTKPRLKFLEKALADFDNENKDNALKKHPATNKELQSDRLYLYYLQNGKDMYTEKELDIDSLYNYDVDHVIPQSFLKDDSLDNRVLTTQEENRGGKLDNVPDKSVADARETFWRNLHKSGLISDRKLNNLLKGKNGGLTDEDKAGFIHRQLVETRQITKHVAKILHQKYNTEKDEHGKLKRSVRIITLKSVMVGKFRYSFGLPKVREINDYHHAHDAYLNGVVALALLKVHPKVTPEFVYGEYSKIDLKERDKATAKKEFYSNIMKFFSEENVPDPETGEILWDKKRALKIIRGVLNYRQMNIVKKVEIQTGEFSKATVKPKGKSDKLIPRKKQWDTAKYGGFDSPNIAYSVVIDYEKKQKTKKAIVGITIMERAAFEKDEIGFLEKKGYQNPKIQVKLPKYSLYAFDDGRKRLLASDGEAQKGNQMVLPQELTTLLYHAKRLEDKKSLEYIDENKEKFAEILEHVKVFAEKYTLADKNLATVVELYEANKNADSKELAESFVNLMQLNAMGAPADFKFFGETIPRKRYTTVTELLKATVIYQSITGLYETHRKLGE